MQAGRLAAPVEALGLNPHGRVLAREARTSECGDLARARRLEPSAEPSELPAPDPLPAVDGVVETGEHLAGVRSSGGP